MPSVQVSATDSELVSLPPVCVKTGLPTDDVVTVRGNASPQWTGVMVVFGFLAWLASMLLSGRRYSLEVPLQEHVLRRHRDLGRAGVVAAVAGFLLGLVAAYGGGDAAIWFLGIAAAGLVICVVNEWVNSFGVRLAPDGSLVLTRVHPRFRDAVLDRTRTG
jgi:hypothetical protein